MVDADGEELLELLASGLSPAERSRVLAAVAAAQREELDAALRGAPTRLWSDAGKVHNHGRNSASSAAEQSTPRRPRSKPPTVPRPR